MNATFKQAKQFFVQGLGHYQAGRFEEAARDFAASLALLPGRPSTLTNLGAAQLKLGKFQEAADLLEEALAQEPGNAEALGHRATALAELGRPEQALACVERALAAEPGLGAAWTLRGSLLKDLGRPAEAEAAYRQAIAHGADPELTRYFLAALACEEAPRAPPRQYVESLFDGYAEGFEAHLVEVLKYRAPQLLVDGLGAMRGRFECALDLGCGTGLCGLLVKPLADTVHGVDLSSNMVERAAARGIYDALAQADLAQYLETTPHRYDLVLAADVFIYVGALESVFAGAARVMPQGGVFCFSLEACTEGPDLALRPSLRYAHSLRYIQKLAEQYGFENRATASHSIREDQGKPIPGLFAWLVRR